MDRLVILADCGLDDACAVAYLAGHYKLFDGIDVVSIAGNISEQISFNNLKRLLGALESENAGITKNVRLCSTAGILQKACPLPAVHGSDGMGDLVLGNMADINIVNFDVVLDDIVKRGSECTVLSLGPLTVTKHILDKCKDKPKLVIMAGIVDEVPNYEGVEFNQALDIPAYKHCVNNFEHVIATLDTCRADEFNLAGHRFSGGILSKLTNRANELAEIRHPQNSYIYDFIASLYLVKPHIFQAVKTSDRMGSTLNQLKIADHDFFLGHEIK